MRNSSSIVVVRGIRGIRAIGRFVDLSQAVGTIFGVPPIFYKISLEYVEM